MQDRTHVADLVERWIEGWTVSRGAADAVREPWGWTIDVGLAHEVTRHLLPEPTEAEVSKIAAATRAPGIWLKLFADAGQVRPWLAPGWEVDQQVYLMTTPLDSAAPPGWAPERAPQGYVVSSWTRGDVARVLVRTEDGAFAARGQAGIAGSTAVPDQISTAPEHRRRGLGALVMRTLQHTARESGARAGVLVASQEGRELYRALGWAERSPMTSVVHRPR